MIPTQHAIERLDEWIGRTGNVPTAQWLETMRRTIREADAPRQALALVQEMDHMATADPDYPEKVHVADLIRRVHLIAQAARGDG